MYSSRARSQAARVRYRATPVARRELARDRGLDGIGRPGLLEGPSTDLLAAAYAEVSEDQS